jgi:hypothetical protein
MKIEYFGVGSGAEWVSMCLDDYYEGGLHVQFTFRVLRDGK